MAKRSPARKAVGTPAAAPEDSFETVLERLPRGVTPALLALFTFALFARSLFQPVHAWDDQVYLFEDPRLEGLTLHHLAEILTEPFFANYHPLTTLTYALDRAAWGRFAPGFHLTQLAFYVASVLLVYALFRHLLGLRSVALLAASIYAAHTIHVEPVAWLGARKDVVCLFFFAATLLAHVRAVAKVRAGAPGLALVFALGTAAMLAKGYAVVLPGVLLAYDACFLPRVDRRRLLEKVPLVAVALALTAFTIRAQQHDSALLEAQLPVPARLVLLSKVFAVYCAHSLLPIGLSANYTVGTDWLGDGAALAGVVLLASAIIAFWRLRRAAPVIAFGVSLYLLPLATVFNVSAALRTWITDRYLILPTVGSTLVLAALALRVAGGRATRGVLIAGAAVLALYSGLTVARVEVWRSDVGIWSDVLREGLGIPSSGPVLASELRPLGAGLAREAQALNYLADAYEQAGARAEATALKGLLGEVTAGSGAPSGSEVSAARSAIDAGRYDEAIRILEPVAQSPGWMQPIALGWIGVALGKKGSFEEARRAHQRSMDAYRQSGRPTTQAKLDLGALEFSAHDLAKAAEWFEAARSESPGDARALFYLGRALEDSGKLEEAARLYERTIDLGPLPLGAAFRLTDVRIQEGLLAERLGRPAEAARFFEQALGLDPALPQAQPLRDRIKTLRASAPR